MKIEKNILLFFATFCWCQSAAAVELTQFAGAAHGFPTLFDLNGKRLADAEFTQRLEGERLHVRISYQYKSGQRVEEDGVFLQKPELIQESWSWRELKDEQLSREFTVDFAARTATAKKRDKGEMKSWSQKIDIQPGRTFAGFGFTLALENLRKKLLDGERIELQAVGFHPKPIVVGVELSYGGVNEMEMSDRSLIGDRFVIHPKIPSIAKIFVKIVDTQIWLTKPPAGFLRWEGSMGEPDDPMIRVDLIPGEQSGEAKPVHPTEAQKPD